MTLRVLTALRDDIEGRLVSLVSNRGECTVTRRCADLADLLASAAAGHGDVVLLSADLRGLDLSALRTLREAGVGTVGVVGLGEAEAGRHRLRQLGVGSVVTDAVGDDELAAALAQAAESVAAGAHAPFGRAEASSTADPDAALADLVEQLASGRPDRPGRDGEDDNRPGVRDGHDGHELGQASGQGAERDGLGHLVTVWGPLGAPGRTMLAVSLACELAVAGHRVLLVDADTYGPSIAQTLALLDEAPGLAAACRAAEQGRLDAATLVRHAPEVVPGLRVLTGLPRADRWVELGAAAVERVLQVATGVVDVVVVDAGFCLEDDAELSYDTLAPRRNAAACTALDLAHLVVAVGAADPVGVQRLVRGLAELSDRGTPADLLVLNRVRPGALGPAGTEHARAVVERYAGVQVHHVLPEDRGTMDAALLAGRTLLETGPRTALRRAVAQVCDSVTSALRGELVS
ncbi:hypothetical protein MM440_11055 [Arsenicicoccus piscis]|uniref:Pilus biosynthesis protein CpaE n=1 Tax=Arsenicicoccus piscis TaxID=673954 RepID=A0ABQ6HM45_9MICO|nr:hypothetical protein [Arsenicicoccus piscis]MCH8628298.1 hypothetical protein [Arsenicicoccus piscis]GMA18559.1 pilus biosynthesis protein CpaE [Arsenicicoccus piscis]